MPGCGQKSQGLKPIISHPNPRKDSKSIMGMSSQKRKGFGVSFSQGSVLTPGEKKAFVEEEKVSWKCAPEGASNK